MSFSLQLDDKCVEQGKKLKLLEHQLAIEKKRADMADRNLKMKLEQVCMSVRMCVCVCVFSINFVYVPTQT